MLEVVLIVDRRECWIRMEINLIKKRVIIGFLILSILVTCFPFEVNATVAPEIVAQAGLVMDMKSGQVLLEKGEANKKMYPASTTKVLTALLAIENCSLDEIVTVASEATFPGGSCIGLQSGEKMTVKNLLYALLLSSANDAALALAIHVGGSVEEFAVLMNKRAEEIGATHSHFNNPNGLPDENHYTTARDLAMIAREAMQNETFREIVGTYNYKIVRNLPAEIQEEAQSEFVNTNKLLWQDSSFAYEGAFGIKTGFTNDAGLCLVGAAKKNYVELLTVVLKSENGEVYNDTKALFNYVFSNLQTINLVKNGEQVDFLKVKGGKSRTVAAIADQAFDHSFLLGNETNITKEIEWIENPIEAPVYQEDILGYLVFYENGEEIGKVFLKACSNVEQRPLFHISFLIYLILGMVILIVIYEIIMKKRHPRRRKYYF